MQSLRADDRRLQDSNPHNPAQLGLKTVSREREACLYYMKFWPASAIAAPWLEALP